MNILFLDFLQFQAFFSKPDQNQGFLGMRSFLFFLAFEGGVVSPRTFGFFGIPAVLGPSFE